MGPLKLLLKGLVWYFKGVRPWQKSFSYYLEDEIERCYNFNGLGNRKFIFVGASRMHYQKMATLTYIIA